MPQPAHVQILIYIRMYEKARTEDLRSSLAMEVVMGHGPSGSFSVRDDEKVEAVDLLEESWFFGNSLERRKMMSRCFSDPCTSPNFCQEMMVRNSYANDHSNPSTLPCSGRRGANQEEEPGSGQGKSKPKPARKHLLRIPSLPPSVGSSKEGEAQPKDLEAQPNLLRAPSMPPCVGMEGRGSRLTRATSLSPSDLLPPPQHTSSKGLRRSYSTVRHRRPRKQEEETMSMSMDVAKEMRRRYLNQNKVMRKSLNDLEYEELQGFKDLGFTFEKEDLTPSVVNILPGLQEKDRGDQTEEDCVRRPYLSEAWLQQSLPPPPIPNCVSKNSEQDMKAQIKFWARAVASNVRQEC